MELFSLLAKLTLDSSEFESGISDAEKSLENIDSPDDLSLELDTTDFDGNLAASEQNAEGFEANMTSVFGGIKDALVATGIVGAIAGVVNGIKEAVDMTAATADGIDKGSKRLGISAKSYQAWDHALRQSGASINDLQKGVLLFNKAIEGEATDDLKDAFSSLGIDPQKFKSSEQLIETTLTKLAELPNDAERMNLVTALFGKGGTSLNAFLDSGVEGVKELLGEAEGLGLIMSQDEIDQAVAYGDAVANLNEELAAIKSAFVADIIPVLTEATTFLTDLLKQFNPRLRENSLSETFDQIDQRTTESIKKAEENEAKAEELIEKISGMGDYFTLDESGKKTYDALLQELIDLYPQLDTVLNNNKDAIYDNRDAITANIKEWTKLEQQRILDENLAEKKKAVAEKYAKALDKEIDAEIKSAEAEAKRKKAIEEINKAMEESGSEARLGSDASLQDVYDFINANTKAGSDLELQAVELTEGWSELEEEAANLRSESEKMYEEADEAQKGLDKYAKQLAEHLGITLEDSNAVVQSLAEIQALVKDTNGTLRVSFTPQAYTKAIGDEYIPYDNFPALLHRGEKVVTATDARRENNTPDLSGLADSIVSAIREGMEGATVNSYLDGQAVTDAVSRNLAGQLADRRYV